MQSFFVRVVANGHTPKDCPVYPRLGRETFSIFVFADGFAEAEKKALEACQTLDMLEHTRRWNIKDATYTFEVVHMNKVFHPVLRESGEVIFPVWSESEARP